MKVKNYLVFLILSIFLVGCPGIVDSLSYEQLSGNYVFDEEASWSYIYRDEPTRKYIPGLVIDYQFNESFIVATQRDLTLTYEIKKDKTSEEIRSYVYKNGTDFYWIISHERDSIYGPLTLSDYVEQKNNLGVSENLRLEAED